MGSYFPPLNLDGDADERAVKRAYALALKETRPDADPVAFQALVAARDRALDWVRRRGRILIPDTIDLPGIIGGDGGIAVPVPDKTESPEAPPADPLKDAILVTPDHPVQQRVLPVLQPIATIVRLPPMTVSPTLSDTGSFAALVRAQQISREALADMAASLIRAEVSGDDAAAPDRWAQLLVAADELDLSGRMALERVIALNLDVAMQQRLGTEAADGSGIESAGMEDLAATVLTLDQAFRWSSDLRRLARILGEPSGAHPLIFAVERFGEHAVRLRRTPEGFPLIPDGDLAAWFGTLEHPSVRIYRRAKATGRFGLGWSWYALLSPPAWGVHIGLTPWAIGYAAAAILAVYVLFDPIATVGAAHAFMTFLFVMTAFRIGLAVSARNLEIAQLIRVITRIEAVALPTVAERRRLITGAHGARFVNLVCGLMFLLLVDGFGLSLIIPALSLPTPLVAEMIALPDRKIQGVVFVDRLVAQSYLDHARELAGEIDDLIKAEKPDAANSLRTRRIERLQADFVRMVKTVPIGDYAPQFERFRRDIAQLKRRQ